MKVDFVTWIILWLALCGSLYLLLQLRLMRPDKRDSELRDLREKRFQEEQAYVMNILDQWDKKYGPIPEPSNGKPKLK